MNLLRDAESWEWVWVGGIRGRMMPGRKDIRDIVLEYFANVKLLVGWQQPSCLTRIYVQIVTLTCFLATISSVHQWF